MRLELITKRNDLVIRRMVLDPGEPMFWHRYACHRFTVVVRGSRLAIEYRDIKKTLEFEVHAGMADWMSQSNKFIEQSIQETSHTRR